MEPSQEIRDAVIRLYESMATADQAAIERAFPRHEGVLAIGSDPEEWWSGHEAITRAFQGQLEATGTRRIIPGDLSTYAEGTVGWASDRRVMRRANGNELTIRETFVFHKEADEWKIVQMHASLAMPNDQAFGQ
jgi:SnoaL-like domain